MRWKGKIIPDPPNSIGKTSTPKNTPAGTELNSKIVDEVGIICDYDDELYYKVFQLIQYSDDEGDRAFRIAYWRYNEDKNRWIWGQYHQMIHIDEWNELYQKAKAKGFFDRYKD